jgi:hypothetical protein
MRTNTQEAVLSAYIASIGKSTPREAAQNAAELCRLANSLSHPRLHSATLIQSFGLQITSILIQRRSPTTRKFSGWYSIRKRIAAGLKPI